VFQLGAPRKPLKSLDVPTVPTVPTGFDERVGLTTRLRNYRNEQVRDLYAKVVGTVGTCTCTK